MRQEKQSIIDEIRAGLTESSFVILVDYRGMKAGQANDLRGRLFNQNAKLQIVKNTLFKRAVDDGVRDKLGDGPTGASAIVMGNGDLVAISKLLKEFRRDHELPLVKMGLWQGNVLAPEEIELLAELPPKPVLQGMVLGLIAAPMAQLVGVMQQRLASLVYVLKAVEENRSKTL